MSIEEKLSKLSKDDAKIVKFFLDEINIRILDYSSLIKRLQESDYTEYKSICYDEARKGILESDKRIINLEYYPDSFIKDNDDIFKSYLDSDLKDRYYHRCLTIEDIYKTRDDFQNINYANFMGISGIVKEIGNEGLIYFINNHNDTFTHILENNDFNLLIRCYRKGNNIEDTLTNTIRNYFIARNHFFSSNPIPEWLKSFHFNKVIYNYHSLSEIVNYDNHTLLISTSQRRLLDTCNIEYLIRFNDETKFFSRVNGNFTNYNFNALAEFINKNSMTFSKDLTYEEFREIMAKCIGLLRKTSIYDCPSDDDYFSPSYDFIEGKFRSDYPEIFMDKNYPLYLRKAFYENEIDAGFICSREPDIRYLENYNLENLLSGNYSCNDGKINFIEYYSNLYGNKETLILLSKYGKFLDYLCDFKFDINLSKDELDKLIRHYVYEEIINEKYEGYMFLRIVSEFTEEYPDIFLSAAEEKLIEKELPDGYDADYFIDDFYQRKISYEYFRKYKWAIEILKNKKLNFLISCDKNRNLIDSEYFLELCGCYGKYLEDIKDIDKYLNLPIHEVKKKIEEEIIANCKNGISEYNEDDAPEFLKKKAPELFLNAGAPDSLKDYFYNGKLNFVDLARIPEWVPFLDGKSVITAFLKNKCFLKNDILKYFELFKDKALKLGVKKADTVEWMITSHKVDVMYEWYQKTGYKFIPDFVVMENMSVNEADKFLSSIKEWSKFTKLPIYNNSNESKEAILKLAYAFGVFDKDMVGTNKLYELLTSIPRYYKKSEIDKLLNMEKYIIGYNNNPYHIGYPPDCTEEYNRLKEKLSKEGIEFNDDKMFTQLFFINDSGRATFKLNPQKYPKAVEELRSILEYFDIVLNGEELHKLFGDFKLIYDKNFYEFLLNNLDIIRIDPECRQYIGSIQRQFKEIVAYNSNRTFTLDMALKYVETNRYTDVEIGNECLAQVCSQAGYTQEDFGILQQIYNCGKQRIFSSIPRINGAYKNYTYEILRLDDPLGIAIGTLSDCCQEINGIAEVCMEHSMTSLDGRVFVIKDNLGNIVAQSWVWRNKSLLCFDNIEVPDRALVRASYNKDILLEDIYNIYKKVALKILKIDNIKYNELLKNNLITEEEYNILKLKKVNVGIGWNDIKEVIEKNLQKENIRVMPLKYNPPVELYHRMYLHDSEIQYKLVNMGDYIESDIKPLYLYYDEPIIYNKDNFTDTLLVLLNHLEESTIGVVNNTYIDEEDSENIISAVAQNYGFDSNNTYIVMNYNFAIVYEKVNNIVKIGDIFYTSLDDITLTNLKIAYSFITENMKVDESKLSKIEKEILEKITNLSESFEEDKGISRKMKKK